MADKPLLELVVEYMGIDDHTPFWYDGAPLEHGAAEGGIGLTSDLVVRGMDWEELWLRHYNLGGQHGIQGLELWDSTENALGWAVAGIQLYRDLANTLSHLDVRVDLWP